MQNVNPINWFDIHVSDLDRAKKFYETVFDVQLMDFPLEWGRQSAFPFDPSGKNASGALVEKKDMVPSESNTIIYFDSEDCVTEQARVEKAGGKVVRPKMAIGEFGFIAILLDTEGNTIGLHSRK